MFSYYLKRIRVFFAAYITTGLITTLILMFFSLMDLDLSVLAILKTWAVSALFLTAEFCFFIIPFILYLLVLPQKFHNGKLDKFITFGIFSISLYLFIFKSVSEYFFWEEFLSRFNFIAVDYLVYTQEVVQNIYESYPIIKILLAAFIFTCGASLLFRNLFTAQKTTAPKFSKRFAAFAINITACVLIASFTSPAFGEITENRINNELAKSGAYGFVYAFFHNELEYKTYYPTLPEEEADSVLSGKVNLDKKIRPDGKEINPNVIIVLMESMSAKYLQESDEHNQPFTPNLRDFASKGIYFPNTYATGTRTVRGIEALTIGVPPLPGMSIVRRKGNENIYNIGSIFRSKGYDTEFIYGGIGFFDNMNYYFKNNGFEITDKTDFAKNEIRFANAWGVSDEDLFAKVISQADDKYKKKEKFLQFIITTSNHRPFTYPDNTIDIPSGTGRNGAVKYADYAIGQFIKDASTKPWFDNTVFVFIADHEAGSAGKDELNPSEHRIPFIIYAPKIVKPEYRDVKISQIDALPTLFALLNFNYENKFFGQNAMSNNYITRYYLINYQKIGYVEDNVLTILKPVKKADFYKTATMEKYGNEIINQKYYKTAVSLFQKADNWKQLLKL